MLACADRDVAPETAPAKRRTGAERRPCLRSREERDKLVLANLGLVGGLLTRWGMNGHRHHDDLHSAGVIGLLRAAELFDETRGIRFSTFADYWIRQVIGRETRRLGLVALPDHVSAAERNALRRKFTPLSLSYATSREGDDFGSILPDQRGTEAGDAAEAEEARQRFEGMLRVLPARHAHVLRLRFVEGLTLTDVGKHLGISRERVRQVEAKALGKLRERVKLTVC